MNSLHERNRFYISDNEQGKISNYKILLAGCGIGSNIAECALRLGFNKQTLIDGDIVDLSNLNRQSYMMDRIKNSKSGSLKNRLLDINTDEEIESHSVFLNNENIRGYLTGYNATLNAWTSIRYSISI